MPYGSYSGPDKPNKGQENGACNRQRCQAEPARWYNHGSYSWYCDDCRRDIGFDHVNLAHWQRDWQPKCGHPQFETREQMDAREKTARPDPIGQTVLGALLASAHMSGLYRDQRPYRKPRDITHVVSPEKQSKRAKRRAKGRSA